MFTIQGCSPKRGEICSCTHVPEIQCTHIKIISFMLKGSCQVAKPFSTRFFFLFIFYDLFFYTGVQYMYFSFDIVYHSSSIHSSRLEKVFDVGLLRLQVFFSR